MSNFKEDIKVLSDEDKKIIMVDILIAMLNATTTLSEVEIKKATNGNADKLSPDEFIAIYSLAFEIKKCVFSSRINKKLFEFLNMDEYCVNDKGNLLKFIKATVKDIEQSRIYSSKSKWSLQIDKIFDRMEGKNPYEDEMKVINYRKNNIKIVGE